MIKIKNGMILMIKVRLFYDKFIKIRIDYFWIFLFLKNK